MFQWLFYKGVLLSDLKDDYIPGTVTSSFRLDRFIVRNKPTGKGLEIMKEALRYNKIKELYNQLADMMKERHNIKCVRKPVFENEPKAKNITHIVFEPIENKTKAAA